MHVLTQGQWDGFVQAMSHEIPVDDPAEVTLAFAHGPWKGCASITSADQATLIIFLSHLAETLSPDARRAMVTLRWLADQVQVRSRGPVMADYYIPEVVVQ